MRLSSVLVQLATLLVAAGCSEDSTSNHGLTCSGDGPELKLAAADACAILAQPYEHMVEPWSVVNAACRQACGDGSNFCDFPQDFIDAYNAANPDAGADAGADAGPGTCP